MTENGAVTIGTTGATCCHTICRPYNRRPGCRACSFLSCRAESRQFKEQRLSSRRGDLEIALPCFIRVNPRNSRLSYEKNRNPFWPGTQFPASVCRAGESENGRQRHRRGVRQDRQGDPG